MYFTQESDITQCRSVPPVAVVKPFKLSSLTSHLPYYALMKPSYVEIRENDLLKSPQLIIIYGFILQFLFS